MGVWDFEGTYTRFKTLGAKRYLVEHDGKLQLTVAGLSKQNGIAYMIEQCNGDFGKVFEMFNELSEFGLLNVSIGGLLWVFWKVLTVFCFVLHISLYLCRYIFMQRGVCYFPI